MACDDPTPAIGFISSSYVGHFYPTLPLARLLEKRGFKIIYLLLENCKNDIRTKIRQEGFSCEESGDSVQLQQLDHFIRTFRWKEAKQVVRQQVTKVREWALAKNIKLLLVDNFIRYLGTAATMNGIPIVTLCFNYSENVFVSEPITARNRLRKLDRASRSIGPLLRRWRKYPGYALDLLWGVQREAIRYARKHHIKTEFFIYNQVRTFRYPVLYFAPAQLLPEKLRVGNFLGLCVEPRVSAGTVSDPRWLASPGLIYASLGTLSFQSPHAKELLLKIIAAFSQPYGPELVLHVGTIDVAEFGIPPARVRIFREVPQTDLIERSSLVITHGGLGTIKECIHFGIPMLLIPLQTEQLYNARLVVENGMGLQLAVESVSVDEIERTMKMVREHPRFKDQVIAKRTEIHRDNALSRGADFVEAMVRPIEWAREVPFALSA